MFTNRALLVMFLVFTIMKVGDLGFQINGASYFWRYYMKDMPSMSNFMMFRSLAHALGAAFGLIWLRYLKDSRRAFICAGIIDLGILTAATLFLPRLSSTNYIMMMSVGQFFRGLEKAYILPFFAAAVDWGTWKTGVRAHGLNMAVYTLCTSLASVVGTWLRTALFQYTGYNAAAYAQGAAPSQAVLGAIGNMAVGYPLALIGFSILIFIFGFQINDSKLKEIKAELKAREAAAASAATT
jgi:Na+/melibiose symporter-like transporter